MSTQEPSRTITPEMRRELLAAWDAATAARFSTDTTPREYGRALDRLSILWFRVQLSFPMPPGLTGEGY